MGWVIPTSTPPEADATWEHGLSAGDVIGVRPVTDRSFLSTTRQFSMLHICPSSYNDFLAMVAMKPGMYLAGADVPTPGVNMPAPVRDECLEALIIPTGRGDACDMPPAAT
uniref:XS domain containing protein-like n=1 Tax=Oryza rufipogon TaxID=4529 RepID=A0A679BCH7_ORYRU|nr:XS domain containing protein-like [Oryza rufipogon]